MSVLDLPTLTREQIASLSVEQRVAILAAATPRLVEPYVPHAPHPPQQVFLLDEGREAFYGGAAGGGKSDALLMAALQYVDVPRYSALIIRKTWADLSQPGAIMERADTWLRDTPARSHDGGRWWTFPSGARLSFGFVQYPRDVYGFKSAEYQYVAFDELTSFVESSYTYLFSRIRRPALGCEGCSVKVEKVGPGERSITQSGLVGGEVADVNGWVHRRSQSNYMQRCNRPRPSRRAIAEYGPSAIDGTTLFDVPLRMRAASNPGDLGHAWVRDRFIDPARKIRSARFYPARLVDNPSLDQEQYEEALMHLDPVERARLLNGDWDVTESGAMFQREWFPVITREQVPNLVNGEIRVRAWDFAATKVAATKDRNDPDFTVGALVSLRDGVWYVEDVVRVRFDPHALEQLVANVASQDGLSTRIRVEREPGSSGKITVDHYRRHIVPGYDFDEFRPTTAKEERARLWAAAAGAGNLRLVEGEWVRPFIDEATAFPFGAHDDQVDSVSMAVESIAGRRKRRGLL